MQFNAIERMLVLANVLPTNGSIADMSCVRSLRKKLVLTEEETSAIKMSEEVNKKNNSVVTTIIKDRPAAEKLFVAVEISENEKVLLKKCVTRLDAAGEVTEHLLDLLTRIRDLP